MFLYCFFGMLAILLIPFDVMVVCALMAAAAASLASYPLLSISLLILGGLIWLTVKAVRGVKRGVVALWRMVPAPGWVRPVRVEPPMLVRTTIAAE